MKISRMTREGLKSSLDCNNVLEKIGIKASSEELFLLLTKDVKHPLETNIYTI